MKWHCTLREANPGPGLKERQCSLQIDFSSVDKMRIAIVFGVTGKRISDEEIAEVSGYLLAKECLGGRYGLCRMGQTNACTSYCGYG